jgi:hypothetical protein
MHRGWNYLILNGFTHSHMRGPTFFCGLRHLRRKNLNVIIILIEFVWPAVQFPKQYRSESVVIVLGLGERLLEGTWGHVAVPSTPSGHPAHCLNMWGVVWGDPEIPGGGATNAQPCPGVQQIQQYSMVARS